MLPGAVVTLDEDQNAMSAKPALRCFLILLACFRPAVAQKPEAPDRSMRRPISVTLAIGPVAGGPSSDLVTQMRAQGFADTSPALCFFSPCSEITAHPRAQSPSGLGRVGPSSDPRALGHWLSQGAPSDDARADP